MNITKQMKINNLIGCSGGINSGKDLVGDMIRYIGSVEYPTYAGFNEFNFDYSTFKVVKFADILKDTICLWLGCTREELEDRNFKEKELGDDWVVWHFYGDDGKWSTEVGDSPEFWQEDIDYQNRRQAEYNKIVDEEYKRNTNFHAVPESLTPRKLLQYLGTECGRKLIHPNIWVNLTFNKYKSIDKGKAHDLKEWGELYGPHVCFNCNATFHGYKRQYLCKDCIENNDIQIYPNWVITDLRFPDNEGKAIKARGGITIGVKRLFRLRFPEYEDLIDCTMDGYEIPKELKEVNPDLYRNLTHGSEISMGDHSWCDIIIENNDTMEDLFNNVLNAIVCQEELL